MEAKTKSLPRNVGIINAEMSLLKKLGFERIEWIDTDFPRDPFYKYKWVRYERRILNDLYVYVYYLYVTDNGLDYHYSLTDCSFTVNDDVHHLNCGVSKIPMIVSALATEGGLS